MASPKKKRTTKKRPARKSPPKKKPKATRASYSDSFKANAVQRVISGETQTAVAKSLGVSQVTLSSWKRKFEQMASESITPKASAPPKTKLGVGSALTSITLYELTPSELSTLAQAAKIISRLEERVVRIGR